MARSDQRSPTYRDPAQPTSEQVTQVVPAEASAEQVPPLLSENVLNQIVGMVLRRANVQAAAEPSAGQADVLAAFAQMLRPPPLTPEALKAIEKYQILSQALTHD